ncbi:MAG: condensation domain-containing protein, partial [Cytophagales bacterium]|nr:condensation domain-containing protein [Cytophagales bacterium]
MDIAIIGIAFRMPDASSFEDLYQNLKNEKCSSGMISDSRKRKTNLPLNGDYKICGFLEEVDEFDYSFFNIPLAEAETMDPHQRILLEVVYETFDNAGYDISEFENLDIPVFASLSNLKYYELADKFSPTLITGNTGEFLVSRVSNFFGLTGNAVMVNTSCSSSLVAIHMACNELKSGDAEYALVCGSNLELFPFKQELGDFKIEASDGLCKSFSDEADGMGFGEIVACVLLKPLKKAIKDKDNIHAVIAGSAVNNNGNRSSSLTAPDSLTQAEVFKKAWKSSGVSPSALGYIEAHGSGTRLGDSIEIGALDLAYKSSMNDVSLHKCPISTIKSNIGHGRAASGLAGLIKAVLSLKSQKLFPSVNFKSPNSLIDFEKSWVYVNTEFKDWKAEGGKPRYAGVTSIGLSGVNCHLVLKEFSLKNKVDLNTNQENEYCLATVSAKNEASLLRNLVKLSSKLRSMDQKNIQLNDICYTLAKGRKHYECRYSWVGKDINGFIENIENYLQDKKKKRDPENQSRKYILIISQSSQCPDEVIKYLKANYNDFRKAFILCQGSFKKINNLNKKVFSFQYALCKLLIAKGIEFDFVLGTGIGKLVSKVITEEIKLKEACQMVIKYEEVPELNFTERIKKLIEDQTLESSVTFVEVGFDGTFSSEMTKDEYQDSDFDFFYIKSGSESDFFLDIVSSLYNTNYTVDWSLIYKKRHGRKVELNTYQFDRKRCWLREEEDTHTGDMKSAENISEIQSDEETNLIKGGDHAYSMIETYIKRYWADVLNTEKISFDDDFFEIGGDSLKASQIINRINREFRLNLSFEDLFDFPTVLSISDLIKSQISVVILITFYWKEALKIPEIKETDNFFELGGHSLLANNMINRINKEFGLELSFDDLFRHSTVSSFATYVESKKKTKEQNAVTRTINRIEEQDYYSVSHQQKSLWILSHFEGQGVEYNTPFALTIIGNLNLTSMRLAFFALVNRHEILRTKIISVNGEAKQKICSVEAASSQLRFVDLSLQKCPEQLAHNKIVEDANTPFDLQNETLFKVNVLKLKDNEFRVALNIHHVISDNWSMEILTKEFLSLYNSFRLNEPSNLRELSIQYRDFSHWQNTTLVGDVLIAHKDYWHQKLSDISILHLPLDFHRPALKTNVGNTCSFRLDINSRNKLEHIGKTHGTTLFVATLATFKALLFHYTDQTDIIVGMAVSGRSHSDLEDQLGFYAKILPLRTKVSSDKDFINLLLMVKGTVLEAFEHQMYPFDKMVEDMDLSKDVSRSPVFDVGFSWRSKMDAKYLETNDFGFDLDDYSVEFKISKYDLSFHVTVIEDGLFFEVEYNTSLFKGSTIHRLLIHYKELLKSLIADVTLPLRSYTYLGEEEAQIIRKGFNASSITYPQERTIQGLFEDQVRNSPNSIA